MNTLTKDQIQRLTPEQQEMLATIEVQKTQKREQLLVRARRYRGQQWIPVLVLCILYFVPIFTFEKFLPYCIIFLAMSLWFLIQFHAAGVNRRLDALMELLESDKKKDDHDA
jgi:hypothetical protein